MLEVPFNSVHVSIAIFLELVDVYSLSFFLSFPYRCLFRDVEKCVRRNQMVWSTVGHDTLKLMQSLSDKTCLHLSHKFEVDFWKKSKAKEITNQELPFCVARRLGNNGSR